MSLPDLEHYINNPSQIKNLQPEKLWQLLKQYPYFQTARLMLARQLHDTGHEAFPLALKLAAAYASDRKALRNLIENKVPDKNPVNNAVLDEKKFQESFTPLEVSTPEVENKIVETIMVEPDPVVFNDKQLETIQLIKTRLNNIKYVEDLEESDANNQITSENQEFDEIIEKFLINNPRINSPRRDFFNPVDVAKQSSIEPEDVVTETLAWVYEKQGLNEKAIKIYEKLVLLFPEKSTYFAARIKNLEESRK
jgi:hypothetical protein